MKFALYILGFFVIVYLLCGTAFSQPTYCWADPVEGNGNNHFEDIITDPANGITYSVGYFDGDISTYFPIGLNGTPDMSTTYGGLDGLITKYDALGNEIWAFKIGGTTDDQVRGVQMDPAGNIYITGFYSGTADFTGTSSSITLGAVSAGGDQAFLAKYDSDGNLIWLKTGNGIGDIWGNEISVNSTGVFITGWFEDMSTFTGFPAITSNDFQDVFIAAYELNGTARWLKQAGNIAGPNYNDRGFAITADNNNVYVTGTFPGTLEFPDVPVANLVAYNAGTPTIFIAEYNELTGTRTWEDKIGGTQECQANGIAVDANYIYLAGMLEGLTNFPGGPTTTTTGIGDEIFTCRVNRLSKITDWIHVENNDVGTNAVANDIAVDSVNAIVYVTGSYTGTTNFNSGIDSQTSLGSKDVFMMARNDAGNFIWVQTGGKSGSNNEQAMGISYDLLGGVYVCGWFEQGVTFGIFSLSNGPQDDAFIVKLNCTSNCNPSFNYSLASYCTTDIDPTPIRTGDLGGTFSESSGNLTFISSSTGQIDLSASLTGGPYSVTYTAPGGCDTTFSISITAPPAIANAGPDQVLIGVNSTSFNADNPTVGLGNWSNISGFGNILNISDPNSLVNNLETGDHIFLWTVTNGSCATVADEVVITVIPLTIPNGFSPNDDGKNDLFVVKGLEFLENEVSIFNRWGIELFHSTNYQNNWDGRSISGEKLPEDTYFYIIKTPDFDEEFSGFVVLKR